VSQRFSLLERWHYMLLNAEGKLDFNSVHATEGRDRSLNDLLAMCNPHSSTRTVCSRGWAAKLFVKHARSPKHQRQ
jgi:hypothetical protein